jgi:fructokinase
LGHEAVIVSRVGDDDLGRELRERVRELGLSDEFIQTDREHPTGTVKVTLDENGVPSYRITENVAWDWIEWDDSIVRLRKRCRAVCFGTLAARCSTSHVTIERFASPWATDADPELVVHDINLRTNRGFQCLELGADWLKMNASELEHHGHWCGDIEATVLDTFTNEVVIVTRGGDGSVIIWRGETIREPGVPAQVIDTVGAGDAFTAAMVCLHLEGRPLRECARFANHYAARVCEHMGATPRIDRTEVDRAAFGRE